MIALRFLVIAAATFIAGCSAAISLHQVRVAEPRAATLTGSLYKPAGDGPFPAVVLMHGCGGPGANVTAWAIRLQSEGYVALALDSFGGRNLRRVCGDPSLFTPRARAGDPYAAAASLKALSFIDGERIGAMGFSHGGGTALWAAQTEWAHPDTKLKAFIALYPGCGGMSALSGSTPVLMLLGGLDDWAPSEPCRQLAAASRERGRLVTDITYRDARHAFDASNIQGRVYVSDARRGEGATIEYNPRAHGDAEREVRQFLREHLKR